jgi:hypothetical protein
MKMLTSEILQFFRRENEDSYCLLVDDGVCDWCRWNDSQSGTENNFILQFPIVEASWRLLQRRNPSQIICWLSHINYDLIKTLKRMSQNCEINEFIILTQMMPTAISINLGDENLNFQEQLRQAVHPLPIKLIHIPIYSISMIPQNTALQSKLDLRILTSHINRSLVPLSLTNLGYDITTSKLKRYIFSFFFSRN